MATLRLSDCSNREVVLLNTSLTSLCNYHRQGRTIRASLHRRRNFVAQTTTAISLSLSPLILTSSPPPAKSSEGDPLLSDWQRVYLPIDPGVVLLDIAFVPDDLNHGQYLPASSTYLNASIPLLPFKRLTACRFRCNNLTAFYNSSNFDFDFFFYFFQFCGIA